MKSRKFIFLKISMFMFAISVCRSDSNNVRLKDVLRDSSRYGDSNNRTDGNGNNFEENDFKGATNKIMSRCSSSSNSDNNNNRNNEDNTYRGRNYGFENDRNNEYGDNNYRYNGGNSYNRNNGNSQGQNGNDRYYGRGYNNYGGSYGDNRDGKNCEMSYNDRGDDKSSSGYGYSEYDRGYSNNNNNNNYDSRNQESNSRSNGYDNGYGGSTMNYQRGTYNGRTNSGYYAIRDPNSNIRLKRYNKRDEDNQCISQCIFGYMELLDDDQVPSETAVIKWVQDHIADDDLKRIKTLREIRKCFGRLSTNDIQDGCEYSRELSRCLNLELE